MILLSFEDTFDVAQGLIIQLLQQIRTFQDI